MKKHLVTLLIIETSVALIGAGVIGYTLGKRSTKLDIEQIVKETVDEIIKDESK